MCNMFAALPDTCETRGASPMVEPATTGEIEDGLNWLWRPDDAGEFPSVVKEPFAGTAVAEEAPGEAIKLARLA